MKPRRSWTWSQLVNISWRKKKFELELLEQQVVSPDKPYPSNRASDVADFEETTEVALLTEHQTYPDQMLKMVQFQHQHSIDVLKLQRKQRRIECTFGSHNPLPRAAQPPAQPSVCSFCQACLDYIWTEGCGALAGALVCTGLAVVK